ncbi:hypothetical protein [Streptomyces sp. C184]|uniref:hypothetical protein n=1 Tax=Streptomyces sp. C184 TaxID=3237121 RepID=UPI0034C63DBA
MFNSTLAKIVWILVPIVTMGLAAAVPFVVAAAKSVVKPWVPVVYVIGELVLLGGAMAMRPADSDQPFAGFLILLLIITAATHTGLLDNPRVVFGK